MRREQSGKRHSINVIKTVIRGPIINSPQLTALGRLSSQANNPMGYARILARAVSNSGLPLTVPKSWH